MIDHDASIRNLGNFIYRFQFIERQLDELIILVSNCDDEMIRILISEMDFAKKFKALDVMFARFNDLHSGGEENKLNFHKLMNKVQKLAKRRNDLVHSHYWSYLNLEQRVGLLRKKSTLVSSTGDREDREEELMPENLVEDIENIDHVSQELENYRLSSIDLLYPDAEV
jgi:predicted phosphoadenosine phosphosulfate sulfurtransferase